MTTAQTRLYAYTDGACSGNPGPGGWGVLLTVMQGTTTLDTYELSGGEAETTNNRMELLAAISALEALPEPADIVVVTDSVYVKNGMTGWLDDWKRRGWKTKGNKPVKNLDLWQRLEAAQSGHRVEWRWIKGHAGNRENDRADELSRIGIEPYLKDS